MPLYPDPTACYQLPIPIALVVTFEPDMNTDVMPPLTRWTLLINGVSYAITSSSWIDVHNLFLKTTAPSPPIVTVTLEYEPIHRDLRTVFSTAFHTFGPINVPWCG